MANMSFLPDDYLEKRLQRRTNQICLTLFVVVMAAVIGAYYVTDRQRTEVRAQRQAVVTEFKQAAERLEQLDELHERKSSMIHKAEVTARLLERVPRSLILAELINNMPHAMSVLQLELETRVTRSTPTRPVSALSAAKSRATLKSKKNDEELPPLEVVDVSIKLVGVAATDVEVAQFMSAMGRNPLFTSVDLKFSEQVTIEKQVMRKFSIEMMVNNDINVYEYEPTKLRRAIKQNPMDDSLQSDPLGAGFRTVNDK